MKTKLTFLIYAISILLIDHKSYSQNIGINGTGANAHPSALLDVDDAGTNTKGLLIPRIPLQASNLAAPVTSPAISLLVFNTASASSGTTAVSPGYYYWDGSQWVRFAYSPSGSSANAWTILGNTGTSSASNFIGTTDAQDFVVKTNNTEKMRVMATGNVGIGTSTPTHKLHVSQGNFRNTNNGFSTHEAYSYGTTGHPVFIGYAGGGTESAPVYPLLGATLSSFIGRDVIDGNNALYGGASIYMLANENYSAVNKGSVIQFSTTKNGANFPGERMRIDDKGYVGIGTSAPLEKLDVNGIVRAGSSNSTNGSVILTGTYGGTNDPIVVFGSEFSSGAPALSYCVKTSTTALASFINTHSVTAVDRSALILGGVSAARFYGSPSQLLALGVTPVLPELMRLTDFGSLGIGTTSPSGKLHVFGGNAVIADNAQSNFNVSRTSQILYVDNIKGWSDNGLRIYDGNTNGYIDINNASDTYIQSHNTSGVSPNVLNESGGVTDASYSNILLNPYGGNVGIGSGAASEKLEVLGSVKIVDGTQGAGKVLTSDAFGKASWVESAVSTQKFAYNVAFPATVTVPTPGLLITLGSAFTIATKGIYRVLVDASLPQGMILGIDNQGVSNAVLYSVASNRYYSQYFVYMTAGSHSLILYNDANGAMIDCGPYWTFSIEGPLN